jgi:predicted metal-binding membrane protein
MRKRLGFVIAVLSAAAWLVTYYQFRNMGLLMQVGVPMSLGMEGRANLTSFVLFTGIWLIMMVAMMLPSTYPVLLLHRTISRKRPAGGRHRTFVFAAAYFLVWGAAGSLFYCAYVWIGSFRAGFDPADGLILRGAGLALLLSGLYQLSRFKFACLKHCQSPLDFVMHHWEDGPVGAARTGVRHALYCFGCCWGLMTVLFVMGVMHLGWMAGIGAITLLEKALPRRQWIPRVVGAGFMLMGAAVLAAPSILLWFSSEIALGGLVTP